MDFCHAPSFKQLLLLLLPVVSFGFNVQIPTSNSLGYSTSRKVKASTLDAPFFHIQRNTGTPQFSKAVCKAEQNSEAEQEKEDDPRLYNINLSRATGIDFGTDISFRWVYVLGLEPGGAADMSGLVEKGHQIVAVNGESVLGAPFDYVMQKLASVEGREVGLTFFKGSREELQEATVGTTGPRTVTLTVREKGKPEQQLMAPAGANLRDVLIANNINVYQSITRWTNCKGKQLCGTCIVNIAEGKENCSRKSIDERSTLRDNPETYRLSCVTNMHGDLTVETYPEIGASQWTR